MSEYQTIAYDSGTGTELWTALYQGPAGASSSPVSLGVAPDGSRVYVTGTGSLTSGQTEYATVAYRS
jgi:hypothetical protein